MRQDGAKHISCPFNGRKLRWAWTEAKNVASDMAQLSRCLGEEQGGGDAGVREQVSNMLLKGSGIVLLRLQYLGTVPWLFAGADEVDGAKEIARQMEAVPIGQHDPLTRDIWRRLEGDVRRRAAE